jgi:acyl-CoA thioesterase-1
MPNHPLHLILLLSLIFTTACNSQDDLVPPTPTISYLALGDSYTIGTGIDTADAWPNQLSNRLTEEGVEVANTDIIATNGWTTTALLNGIEDAELGTYNLASLLIGVNNQYGSRPFTIYEKEFNFLLDSAIHFAGSPERVFVVSIPDYGVTPFGSSNSEQIAQEIDMYNDYARQQCTERNIPFINITDISRQLGDSEGALAPDNLHPSAMQYGLWVERMLPVVLDLVEE